MLYYNHNIKVTQMAATAALHKFLVEKVGMTPENVEKNENAFRVDLLQRFKEVDNGEFEFFAAHAMIFDYCKWPPLVQDNTSGNALHNIIPGNTVTTFLTLIYAYLNEKYPGMYIMKDGVIKKL